MEFVFLIMTWWCMIKIWMGMTESMFMTSLWVISRVTIGVCDILRDRGRSGLYKAILIIQINFRISVSTPTWGISGLFKTISVTQIRIGISIATNSGLIKAISVANIYIRINVNVWRTSSWCKAVSVTQFQIRISVSVLSIKKCLIRNSCRSKSIKIRRIRVY